MDEIVLTQTKNKILVILGWFFFIVGIIGIFLPLLPTTPFMLLTAYFFSKGSPKLHAWILARPKIGPAIEEWNHFGVIRKRAKILSISMISLCMSYPILFVPVHITIKLFLVILAISLILFITSRPSLPVSKNQETPDETQY